MTVTAGVDGRVAVLGVSAFYHDAAAALVVDGDIVAAAQQERFSRVKGDAEVPVDAIEYVLTAGDVAPTDLSAVVFYESPFAKFDRLLSTTMTGDVTMLSRFVRSMSSWLPTKLWVARHLGDVLGRHVPVRFCDHHLSHAAGAFYPSPFSSAAIVTVDGVGEWTTTSISHGTDAGIELVEQVEYPHSLGLAYSAFTAYCGFTVNSGEYKLMGLAPYGVPRFAEVIRDQVVHLADDGSFALNPHWFDFHRSERMFHPRVAELFDGPARRADEPITARFADVAASIQVVLDDAMVGLARRAVERTGERRLCLSGGVALNVVSVGHIERSGVVDEVWVQPAAGDAGSALGAALWATHERFAVPRHVVSDDSAMSGALLGPTPSQAGPPAGDVLADYGLVADAVADVSELARRVAVAVADNKVVAVARGPMEFGPRALGARSILADARDPQMQRRLNLSTKFREGFRPFAPVVLAERADEWFEIGDRESPYMLKTYRVRGEHCVATPGPLDAGALPSDELTSDRESDDWSVYEIVSEVRSTIPAVTHVDRSARVQTVRADVHPFVHEVLSVFDELTRCPVMVNTSFNVRGEPVVCSTVDAVECFVGTDVDVLVLEDFWVERAAQDPARLVPRRPSPRRQD